MMKEIHTVALSDSDFIRKGEGDLLELEDGRLLIVYMEFSGEGCDFSRTRIVAKESEDGGRHWRKHRVIAVTPPDAVNLYSPNLIRDRSGAILLIFMRSHSGREGHRYTYELWRSDDEGTTFVRVKEFLHKSPYALCNGVIKRSSSGRLLLPVALDLPQGEGADQSSTVLYSDDDGEHWSTSAHPVELPMRGAMEPHIEETRDGRLLMVMRNQLGSLMMAESCDDGHTWSLPQTTGLRSPESCPELVRLPGSGDLVMIWNPAPYDPSFASHYGRRSPLSAALSRDNGATWSAPRAIEDDLRRAFSNPCCRFLRDGTALVNYWTCLYSEDRFMQPEIDLRVARLAPEWFNF